MGNPVVGDTLARLRKIANVDFDSLIRLQAEGSLTATFDDLTRECDEVVAAARARKKALEAQQRELDLRIESLSGTQNAVDGVILLEPSEEAINMLRTRSSMWSGGHIDSSAPLIEAQLRNKPVAAEAARYLGQPVAVVNVPTSEGQVDLNLIATRVLSPPQGYKLFEDAEKAAAQFNSELSGNTSIVVFDGASSPERWHLLGADLNSGTRRITKESKGMFGGKKVKEVEAPVTAAPTSPTVRGIITTDNRKIGFDKSGMESWPETYSTPLSTRELLDQGLASRYESDLTSALRQRDEVAAELDEIRSTATRIAPFRNRLINNASFVNETTLVDAPGVGSSSTWERETLLQSGDKRIAPVFNSEELATNIPLPGMTPGEAMLYAASNTYPQHVAIMQDSAGPSHMVFLDAFDFSELHSLHPDLRGIIKRDELSAWIVEAATKENPARLVKAFQTPYEAEVARTVEWVNDLVQRNERPVPGKNTWFKHWQDGGVPIYMLKADTLDTAIAEARNIDMGGSKPVHLVELPANARAKYGLLRQDDNVSWSKSDVFQPYVKAVFQGDDVLTGLKHKDV